MMNSNILRHPSDLWVVNLRDGSRIVACRAPWERNTVGENFAEMLPEAEYTRLSSYLISYEMKPAVSETTDGRILIVIPSLMPSASLAVVLVPKIDRDVLLRFLLKRSGVEFDWTEELRTEASGRMPGRVLKFEEELLRLIWEIETMDFSALAPRHVGASERINAFLKKRSVALSDLTGCAVTIGEWQQIESFKDFDFGIFNAFMLLSLLLFRVKSYGRCAEVCMREEGSNCFVTLNATCEEIHASLSWEISTLDSMTEERLIPFGSTYCDGQLRLYLFPHHFDPSYLGLKAILPF